MNKTFLELSELFKIIENTSSRLDMTSLMGEFLKECSIEEISMISYLIQGRVAPKFVDAEFNFSEKSLLNLTQSYIKSKGLDIDINLIRQDTGDIGDTLEVFSSKSGGKDIDRSIEEVYEILWQIINTTGRGSVERKGSLVIDFLLRASDIEAKYFSRIVCGSLRLGLHSKTMIDVFSYIVTGDKSLSDEFDRVYGVSADIGYIASLLDSFKESEVRKNIDNIQVTPGFPVLSRLVERVGSFDEVVDRLGGEFLVQPKFDGLRLQIHKFDNSSFIKRKTIWQNHMPKPDRGLDLFGSKSPKEDVVVKLYTRNLEDVTEMFPEIVQEAKSIDMSSFVLDSEVLGWDYQKDNFLSYQETMQRKRKYDIEDMKKNIPVRSMIFDLLYINGKDLTSVDTVDRIEEMENLFGKFDGSIKVADTTRVSSLEQLKDIFDEYVSKGLEGLIVKQFKGSYSAGKRNFEWIKLKKSMESGLVDTVDFVVVGYYLGSGRRTQLGVGALLGAIYNEDETKYDAICKVGTGISDSLFKQISLELSPLEVKSQPKNVRVDDVLIPDVWVKPNIVITVDADEVTRDIGKNANGVGKGLSLRFPRLVEWNRDVDLDRVTTVEDLSRIYESRKS